MNKTAGVALPQLLRRKAVREYTNALEQHRREQEARKSKVLPAVGLGLLAGGYGMKRLGDAFITPDDRRTIEDLSGIKARMGVPETDPMAALSSLVPQRDYAGNVRANVGAWWLPTPSASPDFKMSPELFYDYIDRASRASNVKVWGKSVIPLMHAVKDKIGLEDQPLNANSTPLQIEDAKHYPSFQAGPLPAYLHQMRKVVVNPTWDEWLLRDPDTKVKMDLPLPEFQKKLEGHLGDFLKLRTGSADVDAATKSLNHGDQMNIIRQFGGYLDTVDPTIATAKHTAERHLADAQRWAAFGYASIGDMALKAFQDVPRAVGYGLGGAGAGLLGYWGLKKLMAPKPPKPPKELAGMRVEEAEDDDKELALAKTASAMDAVIGQLPGFHPLDATVGAAGGAAAGGLYHLLRKDKTNAAGKSLLARRAVLGALLGAGTADVAGDRARRLLSNSPTMFGYSPGEVWDGVKRDGLEGVIRGGLLDQKLKAKTEDKLYDAERPDGWSDEANMRRELMRRALNVHHETDADTFKQVGSITGADHQNYPKLELHDRFVDPVTKRLNMSRDMWRLLIGDKISDPEKSVAAIGQDYGPGVRQSRVFAGLVTQPFGDIQARGDEPNTPASVRGEAYGGATRVTDLWDFALGPQEKTVMDSLLKDTLHGRGNLDKPVGKGVAQSLLSSNDENTSRKTLLKSLLLRSFFDKFVAHKPALFDQTFVDSSKRNLTLKPLDAEIDSDGPEFFSENKTPLQLVNPSDIAAIQTGKTDVQGGPDDDGWLKKLLSLRLGNIAQPLHPRGTYDRLRVEAAKTNADAAREILRFDRGALAKSSSTHTMQHEIISDRQRAVCRLLSMPKSANALKRFGQYIINAGPGAAAKSDPAFLGREMLGTAAALPLGYAATQMTDKALVEPFSGQPMNPLAVTGGTLIDSVLMSQLTTASGRKNLAKNVGLQLGIKGSLLGVPLGINVGTNLMKDTGTSSANVAASSSSMRDIAEQAQGLWGANYTAIKPDGTRVKVDKAMWDALHPGASAKSDGTGALKMVSEKVPEGWKAGPVETLRDRVGADTQRVGQVLRNALAGPMTPLIFGASGAGIGNLLGATKDIKETTPEAAAANRKRRAWHTLGGGAAGLGAGYIAANYDDIVQNIGKLMHGDAPEVIHTLAKK